MKHPINVALIKLAQRWGYWDGNTAEFSDVGLEEFAAAIRASEREACAKVCDEYAAAKYAAEAIRARGEK